MADFNNAVMTEQGAALLAQCSGGFVKMEFTQLVTGDGEYTESEKTRSNLQQRKTLKNTCHTFPFSKIVMNTPTSVLLTALITNAELSVGYYIREVGIYARAVFDDDAEIDEEIRAAISTEPILYSIAVANIADYLPPYNGLMLSTITQEYYATVSNSTEVTIKAKTGAIALAEDLNTAINQIDDFKSNLETTYQQATGYTDQKIADLINGAPSTLDTLGEIAQAMQDNEDVVLALDDAIGKKANEAEFDSFKKATDALMGNTDMTGVGDGTVTGAIKGLDAQLGDLSFVKCTQAEYDALGSGRPSNTVYIITNDQTQEEQGV